MGQAIEQFIAHWRNADGGERAQSQTFLGDFCRALGLDLPKDGDLSSRLTQSDCSPSQSVTDRMERGLSSHSYAMATAEYAHVFNRGLAGIHRCLRTGPAACRTPAMQAGLSQTVQSWEPILLAVDENERRAIVARRWVLAHTNGVGDAI